MVLVADRGRARGCAASAPTTATCASSPTRTTNTSPVAREDARHEARGDAGRAARTACRRSPPRSSRCARRCASTKWLGGSDAELRRLPHPRPDPVPRLGRPEQPALAADDPLRDWIERCRDLFGGLGRHPGLHELLRAASARGRTRAVHARIVARRHLQAQHRARNRPAPKPSSSPRARRKPDAGSGHAALAGGGRAGAAGAVRGRAQRAPTGRSARPSWRRRWASSTCCARPSRTGSTPR